MMRGPLVSVIMTVYNKPQWLAQAIDSVLGQSYQDYELIIMEDNSPNPAVQSILDNYSDENKIQIHYSHIVEEDRHKTARYATLINEAVTQYAQGKYLAYICDDDVFYPNRLKHMVKHMMLYPEISVLYCAMHNMDADGHIEPNVREATEILADAWDKVDHNAVLHTKESFVTAGGWHDHFGAWGGADAFFWRKLTDAGYLFYPYDEVLCAHRYHTESVQWQISKNVFALDMNGVRHNDD